MHTSSVTVSAIKKELSLGGLTSRISTQKLIDETRSLKSYGNGVIFTKKCGDNTIDFVPLFYCNTQYKVRVSQFKHAITLVLM